MSSLCAVGAGDEHGKKPEAHPTIRDGGAEGGEKDHAHHGEDHASAPMTPAPANHRQYPAVASAGLTSTGLYSASPPEKSGAARRDELDPPAGWGAGAGAGAGSAGAPTAIPGTCGCIRAWSCGGNIDRKSTRLNSSHVKNSY